MTTSVEVQSELPQLLSVRQVAVRTGTGERSVRQWIRERRIKTVRLGGRVLVSQSELRRVCEEGLLQPKV